MGTQISKGAGLLDPGEGSLNCDTIFFYENFSFPYGIPAERWEFLLTSGISRKPLEISQKLLGASETEDGKISGVKWVSHGRREDI